MHPVRLIILGGFLGAGKTTAITRLAKYFTSQKLRVGLITNDQAENLVDTHLVRVEGFNVEEVTGGCFCCRLNDFTDAGERLLTQLAPDVIIAEPVGSCTDLVATVIQPLKLYARDDYSIAPFTVLVDPIRAKEIILLGRTSGFSDKVAYIFKKQLEEADIITLNKIDILSPQDIEWLLSNLRHKFPQANVLGISAKTGEGLEGWLKVLETKGAFGRNITEVDYEIYAQGEAELAWLNFVAELSTLEEFDANVFLCDLAEKIRQALIVNSSEVAHLKLALSTVQGSSSINLVQNATPAALYLKEACRAKEGHLIVNARVHTDHRLLRDIITSCLEDLSKKHNINTEIKFLQSFQPAKPVPVYRFNAPIE